MFFCFLKKSFVRFFVVILILLTSASYSSAQSLQSSASIQAQPVAEAKRNLRTEPGKTAPQNYGEIAAGIERELLLFPQDAMLHNNLGASYALLGRFEDALKKMQRAIEIDSKNALFYRNLSVVYEYLDRPSEALAAVRRSLELDPRNLQSNILFCKLNMITGQFEQAASCYESLINVAPRDVKILTAYGLALVKTKKPDHALRLMEETAALFPAEAATQNGLGLALYAKKSYKKASAAFNRAIEIDPKFDTARVNLALSYLADGNKADALKQYFLIKNSNEDYARQLYKIIYRDKVIFVGER